MKNLYNNKSPVVATQWGEVHQWQKLNGHMKHNITTNYLLSSHGPSFKFSPSHSRMEKNIDNYKCFYKKNLSSILTCEPASPVWGCTVIGTKILQFCTTITNYLHNRFKLTENHPSPLAQVETNSFVPHSGCDASLLKKSADGLALLKGLETLTASTQSPSAQGIISCDLGKLTTEYAQHCETCLRLASLINQSSGKEKSIAHNQLQRAQATRSKLQQKIQNLLEQ